MKMQDSRLGLKLLSAFFAFGAAMCLLTLLLLAFAGSRFDSLWRLNPSAQVGFRVIGNWAYPLMLVVGIACASSSIGLALRREWGRLLAIAVLCVNLIGDLANAAAFHDYRPLIGLPIGGLLIAFLMSAAARHHFAHSSEATSPQ